VPFQLEAVQGNDGDCLLLHYDAGDHPGLIIIDGGSKGVYRGFLKKRLEELRSGSRFLDVRLVMVSHIDADHITGILDMCKELAEMLADGKTPPYRIASLWHNSFEQLNGGRAAVKESSIVGASLAGAVPAGLDPFVEAVVASVAQGNDLRRYASKFTKINPETDSELLEAPETGKKIIKMAAGLTFTVLGPHETELKALEDSWKTSKSSQDTDEAVAADYLNRTVPNLSSIVVLAESTDNGKPRRMLLTGDAGGDKILLGLKTSGLLDKTGNIHVDLLKVQHHGSNHSVDIDFFKKVTADVYVISGNGKHGIPHPDALGWLSKARSGEEYNCYMTNRTGDEGLTANIKKFIASEASNEPKHHYHFREGDDLSIMVEWPEAKAASGG
jgi:beta-lactamase superfamily II metal-dependent hydrolase